MSAPGLTRRQQAELRLQRVELEDDRTRIERVERQKVKDADTAGIDAVLPPVSHDAVADLQQHFQRPLGRIMVRQGRQNACHLDAALKPAADFEEAPAGKAIHVFMHETGEPGKLAQDDRHGTRRVVAGRYHIVRSGGSVFDRSRSASQPSGEKRSRMRPALSIAPSMDRCSPFGIAVSRLTPSGFR